MTRLPRHSRPGWDFSRHIRPSSDPVPTQFRPGREAIVQMSLARGRQEGREEGLREGELRVREEGLREGERIGEQRGLREGELRVREEGLREGELRGLQAGLQEGRARAILDVLRRRGIVVTDAVAEQVVACRDETTLERWWELAWTVTSSDEMIG